MARRPPTQRLPWTAYLWPGLPHLWNEGSWAGLVLALGFTVLLNVLILSTLVWPEWLPERVKLACGVTTGLLWLAAIFETRGELRRQAARRSAETTGAATQVTEAKAAEAQATPAGGDRSADAERTGQRIEELYAAAQHAYLAGDWVRSEQKLDELLRLDRDDVEGRLLLATLWRATGQPVKARRAFERLARRQDAEAWRFEIDNEIRWLDEQQEPSPEPLETTIPLVPPGQTEGPPDERNEEHQSNRDDPQPPRLAA